MEEDKFNKEQILGSKQFSDIEKDVLNVLLTNKEYRLEEVKQLLEDFNKKEVE